MSAVLDIARAALAVLRRDGRRDGAGWSHERERFAVALVGDDLPDDLSNPIADTKLIAASLGWRGAYTLKIRAPRPVFEIAWSKDEPVRIMVFSRGAWEQELGVIGAGDVRGRSWIRRQMLEDALLTRMMRERGLDQIPQQTGQDAETRALGRRPRELAPERDGPVTGTPSQQSADEHARIIKDKVLALGASAVGIARMQPEFIELGKVLPHEWAIGIVVAEDYANVLRGPDAVQRGVYAAYARCAEIATEVAAFIRAELGHAAVAHHNGGCEVQALPLLHQAGIGELGRHGSLINPQLGAFWRPGIVTTTLPLVADAPVEFGVQDYCVNCRLCETACPGDAIAPADDYVVTDGVKRWLVDNEKCFPFSRLREEYCHLCVDVCPYIHKENGDSELKRMFKAFMSDRKLAGFDSPKHKRAAE